MRVKYNMFLFQLDDESNLYLGNGWKSPVPSIKQWLLFRVPITSPNITWFTPEGLTAASPEKVAPGIPVRWSEMGVFKNRGKTRKMDGENHGKPSKKWDDLGGFPPTIFGNIQIGVGLPSWLQVLPFVQSRCGAASRNRCLAGEVMYLPASPSRENASPPSFSTWEIPIGEVGRGDRG